MWAGPQKGTEEPGGEPKFPGPHTGPFLLNCPSPSCQGFPCFIRSQTLSSNGEGLCAEDLVLCIHAMDISFPMKRKEERHCDSQWQHPSPRLNTTCRKALTIRLVFIFKTSICSHRHRKRSLHKPQKNSLLRPTGKSPEPHTPELNGLSYNEQGHPHSLIFLST